MLLTMEKVLFLRRVPIFAALEGDDIHHIADLTTEEKYPAGTVIFRENDQGDSLYVIVEGKVRVLKGIPGGDQKVLAVLDPTDYFGEMSILDGNPRTATVDAVEDVTFLRLSDTDFRLSIEEQPAIAFGVFKALLKRMRDQTAEAPPEAEAPVTAPLIR